jgi:hypothetical protein
MASLLKTSVLSLGLLAGAVAVAQAQSVSSLPPAGAAPQASPPPITSSSQGVFPKPGGNGLWQEEHYQPVTGYDADKAQHPYSTSIGPKPGSHSSGEEQHYQATDQDALPARHPYTGNVGPKPGG